MVSAVYQVTISDLCQIPLRTNTLLKTLLLTYPSCKHQQQCLICDLFNSKGVLLCIPICQLIIFSHVVHLENITGFFKLDMAKWVLLNMYLKLYYTDVF